MEQISYTAAAQRLGCSVEEIEQKVEAGVLREYKPRMVSKEAVYALNGLQLDGKQSSKEKTKKLDEENKMTMTLQATAAFLDIDTEDVQKLIDTNMIQTIADDNGMSRPSIKSVKSYKDTYIPLDEPPKSFQDEKKKEVKKAEPFDLDAVMRDLFDGMQCFSKETRDALLAGSQDTSNLYSSQEMKQIVNMSMKMGRLQVYESMDTFSRRQRKEKK